MRLEPKDVFSIKNIISEFDPSAEVYLFGSRTNDNLKGGDIDLLVISEKITFALKIPLKLKLYDALGEQKIDLLISKKETDSAFVNIAKKEGILL